MAGTVTCRRRAWTGTTNVLETLPKLRCHNVLVLCHFALVLNVIEDREDRLDAQEAARETTVTAHGPNGAGRGANDADAGERKNEEVEDEGSCRTTQAERVGENLDDGKRGGDDGVDVGDGEEEGDDVCTCSSSAKGSRDDWREEYSQQNPTMPTITVPPTTAMGARRPASTASSQRWVAAS